MNQEALVSVIGIGISSMGAMFTLVWKLSSIATQAKVNNDMIMERLSRIEKLTEPMQVLLHKHGEELSALRTKLIALRDNSNVLRHVKEA